MSPLRPVKPTYTPKYPRRLTEAEFRDYLRPGLARRFSNETMVLSTLLAGATLVSCTRVAAEGPGGVEPLPMMGKSTKNDPALRARVERIIGEVVGKYPDGLWNERSEVGHYRLIADNPVIKYPQVGIMFGNSISGVFNIEEARAATARLFDAYGISLDPEVRVESNRYEFEADGFNRAYGVGFELRRMRRHGYILRDRPVFNDEGTLQLGDNEIVELEKDIAREKLKVFVCDNYTLYDHDHRMSLSYYLASVVDYLNWIHGDRGIDFDDVLGETRKLARRPVYPLHGVDDIWVAGGQDAGSRWSIETSASITIRSSHDDANPVLTLAPGASAVYVSPSDEAARLLGENGWSGVAVLFGWTGPAGRAVDVAFELNGDGDTLSRHTMLPSEDGVVRVRYSGETAQTHDVLRRLVITNVNSFPIEVRPKKIGAMGS